MWYLSFARRRQCQHTRSLHSIIQSAPMLQTQVMEYKMANPAISVPRSHCLDLRDQVLLLVPGRSGKSPRRSRKQDDALTRAEPEVPPHRIVESSHFRAGEHRHGPISVSHSIRRCCTPREKREEGCLL